MKHRLQRLSILTAACLAIFSFAKALPVAHASQLSFVSDTINDSRLSWPTNHQIVFKVPSGIPASGQIVVAFEGAPFFIDPSFSYTDVDLAVSTVSPTSGFVERPLAGIPGFLNDGVAITPTTGPITITLASSVGIPAGAYVRIMLGTNAPGGVYQITNPATTASYRILLNTFDQLGGNLDYGAAMVAILPAIGVSANTDVVNPPVLSNGMPSGTIPSNVSGVLVSFNTDTYATCHYATSSGISYDDMTNVTADDELGTTHTFNVDGITQGTTYTFYARCEDFAGNKNPSDYIISFTAGDPTGAPGSGGGGGGGGGAPYPPGAPGPSLTLSGFTVPNATIVVLQDGSKIAPATTADNGGSFSVSIASLPQGTYSFTIQALGTGSTVISSYTATITLITGTSNSITGIVMPPWIGFATSSVALNKLFAMSGLAEPSSTIDIVVTSQAGVRGIFEATTSANQSGAWAYSLSTAGFPMDTYQVKARAFITGLAASNFSTISFLGVGETPVPKLKIGDLNGDNKVNLVDFSIMLAHWGTSYAPADLNDDGIVDLPDLSILLFNWTG